jgi:nucleoside-diphosphate-sugar epimerase
LLAERAGEFRGEAFNIGTNESINILDLTNKIIDLAGKSDSVKPNILLKEKIRHEIDAQYLSAEKLEHRAGWSAGVTLDEGLRESIEWYNQNLSRLV